MKYAITGATGRFGQNAIKQLEKLTDTNDKVIAIARNTEKASKLFNSKVEIRYGDYDQIESMFNALEGIDRLLFISSQPNGKLSRDLQHKNVIEAAKKTGVKYIAYTSFPHADTATTPLAKDHQVTEELIKNSNIQYSFLRNNWYLENEMNLFNGQNFDYSAGNGHVGWALESEYSEAAARVLIMDNPQPIYEFAGKARTYNDLAKEIEKVVGHTVSAIPVSDQEYKNSLMKNGLDDATASLFTLFQTLIREKQLEENTTDLQKILGRELTPLSEAIKKLM